MKSHYLVGKTFVYNHRTATISLWNLTYTDKDKSCARYSFVKTIQLIQSGFLDCEFLQTNTTSDTLTILFNCNDINAAKDNIYDFSKLVTFCKKQNSNLKKINIVPVDTYCHCEDYQGNKQYTKKNIVEFKLYSTFQKHFKSSTLKMFHYNNNLCDDITEYADPCAWYVIQQLIQCVPKIPTRNKPKHKISCLVNTARSQRSFFTVLLTDFDSLLTHNQKLQPNQVTNIPLTNSTIINRIQTLLPVAYQRFRKDELIPGDLNYSRTCIQESIDLIQQAFCDIVTEDPFQSQGSRISEKTLKPIAAMRPFLMVGPSGTLKWLRQQGFQTFSKWWDESYDSETDHIKRLEKIYFLTEEINSWSLPKLYNLLDQMHPILLHNFNYIKYFQKNTIRNIIT